MSHLWITIGGRHQQGHRKCSPACPTLSELSSARGSLSEPPQEVWFTRWTIQGLADESCTCPASRVRTCSSDTSIFSRWTEAFPCGKATASPVAKQSFYQKLFLLGEHRGGQGAHVTGQALGQGCATGRFYSIYFHCLSRSTGPASRRTIRFANFVEALQIPWPRILLLGLLNLRSTPSRVYKLSPFEVITGQIVHLALASFDPRVKKGRIL